MFSEWDGSDQKREEWCEILTFAGETYPRMRTVFFNIYIYFGELASQKTSLALFQKQLLTTAFFLIVLKFSVLFLGKLHTKPCNFTMKGSPWQGLTYFKMLSVDCFYCSEHVVKYLVKFKLVFLHMKTAYVKLWMTRTL